MTGKKHVQEAKSQFASVWVRCSYGAIQSKKMCRIVRPPSLARSHVLEQSIIRSTTTILVDSKFYETC